MTLHVVNKQVVSYVMPLENALRVLSKYSRTTGRSELQHDVIRLSLTSVYHLPLVVEELRHPGDIAAIYQDRMVNSIEGSRQTEQDQGTDVTWSATLITSLCMLTTAVSIEWNGW